MHPVNTARQVGHTLAARRKELKLSQTVVATRLGLSQNRLSELETHPETITVQQLLALLNILGLEMRIAKPSGAKAKVEW